MVEFAGLSPIALLKETLRAAAPEQMVEWHEELIRLRMDEKYLQGEQAAEDAALKQLNNRQNATREDVDRWHTRQELLKKSKNLERCRPIIENNLLKREYVSLKQTRKAAEQDLRQLEADAAPTRQAQEEMEAYRETVQSVRNQRTAHVSRTQKRAEKLAADIKAEQSKITDFATQVNAEKDGEKQRRQELKRLENTIANIEREIADVPPEVDEVGYRQRRKDLSDRLMAGGRQQRETVEKLKDSKDSVTPLRNIIQEKKNEIALLDTQSGQQATLLNRTSADTARAWDWIQQNRDKLQLQGEIYGPPILTCSVDDPRHADIVESQLRPGELITITFTNSEDQRMVSGKVTGKDGLGLHAVNLKTVPKPLAFYRSPLDREDIQELGFQGYILDHIQGPEPVLAMLCDSVQIHRTAYTPHSLSEQQHEAVLRSPIMSWVAGRERYRVTRRREYAGVSSTSVNKINKARFFTDQPVDTEKKRQLNADIHNINREIAEMKEQYETLKADFDRCKAEQNEMKGQMEGLDEEYRSQVRARSQWEALPDKKAEKETDLNAVIELMRQTASRILLIKANSEKAALRSAALAIAYQTTVSELRQGHEGLVDAEIRLVEAISEVDSLKAENEGIIRAIAEAENIKAQSIQREQAVRDKLKSLQDQAKRLIRTLSDEDRAMMQEYSQLPSIEDLENEIEAVNSRLNLMAEGNPQAVHAYENREKEIASKQQRLEQIAQDLEATRAKIAEIRKEWEPRLDELVSTISDGFSHNFAQIGCAGQVGVYKDEDFEKWSIQIQVRFR